MRATFKILFFVNRSKEKNGIVPIMGRVTINGTQAQFSCKYSIAMEQWDTKANKVKGKSKEARDINFALDNIKAQIIKHYQRILDKEAYVTAEMVRNAYQGIGTCGQGQDKENILQTHDSPYPCGKLHQVLLQAERLRHERADGRLHEPVLHLPP